MSLLNLSLERRNEMICETVAQAVLDEPHRGLHVEAVDHLTKNMQVLFEQACAGWSHKFRALLVRTHSIRVQAVDDQTKEKLRARKRRCSACGRFEYLCPESVCMVGRFNRESFKNAAGLHSAWKSFEKEYSAVFDDPSPDWADGRDFGTFCLGKTCLRKLKTAFLCSTIVCDLMFDFVLTDESERPNWAAAKAVELQNKVTALETVVARDKGEPPSLEIDRSFWKQIDERRHSRAFRKGMTTQAMLRALAAESTGKSSALPNDDAWIVEDSDEGESEEEGGGGDGEDEEEQESAQEDDEEPVRPSKRSRRAVVRDEEEKGEVVHVGRRVRSVGGVAGVARASGALKSRNALVAEGLRLAAELAEGGQNVRSATVSALCLTVQELMAQTHSA